MRVVGLDEDVAHADDVALQERRRVVDRAHPEVAPEGVGRAEGDVVPRAVHRVVLAHVLEPVEQAAHPTDAAFRQADAQLGEAHRDARVQPVDRGEHRVPEEQHADGVGRRVGRRHRRRARRADVQAHDRLRSPRTRPSSGSQYPVCSDGSPSRCGASENVIALNPRSALRRTSSAATSGSSRYGSCSGIMRAGREGRPLLDHPVVPRAHARQREIGIVGELLEPLTGEPGEERREAERRVHAVQVHVGDAGADVPRAAAHLVEAGRLEAVLGDGPAHDRVEPDVGHLLALEHPRLAAVGALDDARRAFGERGGETAGEGVGRLDDVVVDRDDREVPFRRLRLGQPRDLARPRW